MFLAAEVAALSPSWPEVVILGVAIIALGAVAITMLIRFP